MSKILILNKALDQTALSALTSLAVDAGCQLADISEIDEVGGPEAQGHDEVVLIILAGPTCSDGTLEEDMKKVHAGGRRAVCVWPKGASGQALPDAVGKYCYSIVAWNADRLRAVLADDDITCFDAPDGTPLPPPNQDHLECK